MNFLLFHGKIESLNHFSDELSDQLRLLGHDTYIADLCGSQNTMVPDKMFDAAICYDCIGTFTDEDIYDTKGIPVVNILMDHPMSFDYCMKSPPLKYIQLSPDENHVQYAKHFFGLKNVFFMPHMASMAAPFTKKSFEEKKISVLFPGSMGSCNDIYREISDRWQSESSKLLVLETLEYLLDHPETTLEDALQKCLMDKNMILPDALIALLLKRSKAVDVFVRMYFRGLAINQIVKAGIPVTVVGGGWSEFWKNKPGNVVIAPSTNFSGIFSYMEDAQITLNVMPWFKAGSHDRIFNALMHYSCPVTDPSSWLLKNFKADQECVYYSLKHLDELPGIIYKLLNCPEFQQSIIENGRKKVENNYTSRQIAEKILGYLENLKE